MKRNDKPQWGWRMRVMGGRRRRPNSKAGRREAHGRAWVVLRDAADTRKVVVRCWGAPFLSTRWVHASGTDNANSRAATKRGRGRGKGGHRAVKIPGGQRPRGSIGHCGVWLGEGEAAGFQTRRAALKLVLSGAHAKVVGSPAGVWDDEGWGRDTRRSRLTPKPTGVDPKRRRRGTDKEVGRRNRAATQRCRAPVAETRACRNNNRANKTRLPLMKSSSQMSTLTRTNVERITRVDCARSMKETLKKRRGRERNRKEIKTTKSKRPRNRGVISFGVVLLVASPNATQPAVCRWWVEAERVGVVALAEVGVQRPSSPAAAGNEIAGGWRCGRTVVQTPPRNPARRR
ncbi:hypothetical protein B0H14DRAFT_2640383 [Mycena olivaceomarginata]|nr:hypothetical protein B0H14DRAFT_2640383 [Mycena olivaceomarginata]